MHGAIALKKTHTEPPVSYRSGPLWFAAFTNPQSEIRAQFGLESLGYRTFVPKLRKWVSHARTKKAVEKPLLSRYVFFEIEPSIDGFRNAKDVDGVEYIIGCDNVPQPMPEGFIGEFIRRQIAGEWDFVSKNEDGTARPIPIGAKVCIMDGRFQNVFAIIVGISRKSGGEVVAQLLESRTRTKLLLTSVRPA